MSILKKIRESFRLSQAELAEAVNIDLKSIEQWEKSPKKITNNGLSSLAYYFGLSSEDLKEAIIGDKSELSTNKYHLFCKESFLDGWWGHIGIGVINQTKTHWFPITLNTANRVSSVLSNYESKHGWIVLDTLNNRTLALEPSRLKHIWLLDDNSDPPNNDWYPPDDYSGMPGEFYKALEAFCHEKNGIELDENEEVSDYSKQDIDTFTEVSDLNLELVENLLTQSHVHDIAGSVKSHTIEAEKLAKFLFYIQHQTATLLDFSSNEEGYELYIPSKNVSLIDMPKRYIDSGSRKMYED